MRFSPPRKRENNKNNLRAIYLILKLNNFDITIN